MTAASASGAETSDRARALRLLRKHGWNATSFQVLEAGFRYWFDEDDSACVAFVETRGAWVVAGAPIADEDALAKCTTRFLEHARAEKKRVCFFGVERRFVEEGALGATRIGEQPVWNPAEWPETLRKSASLREQLRRARAKKVTIRKLEHRDLDPDSSLRKKIDALVGAWLHARPMPAMGFLVGFDPFAFAEERAFFIAERADKADQADHEGELTGFLCAAPIYDRGGWLIENLVRAADAPNGTVELLVDGAMQWAREAKCEYMTLGLAPLSGEVGPWLRAIRRASRPLYSFDGLHAFKARLRPAHWEPVFLAYSRGPTAQLTAIVDTLSAFSKGGLLQFGLRTLFRVPPVVVQALAIALVPWTAMLALVNGRTWFPSESVHWAWVAFDVALVPALLVLSVRWQRWLGALLASAVTLDAALTFVEAATFNAPRTHDFGSMFVVLAAISAPLLASILLWRAWLDESRWRKRSALEGDAPEQPAVLRAIIFYKIARAIGATLLSLTLFVLAATGATDWLHMIALGAREHASSAWAIALAEALVSAVEPRHLWIASAALAVDGSFTFFEGWALHKRWAWGPWLVVIATSVFVPFELASVFRAPHFGRIAVLVLNVAAALYLARQALMKRLKHERSRKVVA